MTTNAPRQNYFVLLGLDPNDTWDDSAFQNLLTQKKAEWTRNARNPKNAKLYNSYLEQVPRIVMVMGDPAARRQEASDARRALAESAARRAQAFHSDFDLYAAKNFITPAEVTTLAQQHAGFITEARVRALMAERGIPETAPAAGAPAAADALDPSTMQNIQSNLDLLGSRDLYDFLSLTTAAPTALLLDRARAVYADNQKQGDKTARVTASSELAGQAISIFRDEDARRRYDSALAQAAYEELGKQVARLVAGTNILYAPQFSRLLELARMNNLDVDRAKEFIVSRARELRAAVEIGGDEQVRQQQRCPNCGTLNDGDARNCRVCGTPLKIECPNCGQIQPTEHRACTNCGFPIGNMTPVIQDIEAGKQLLQARHYAQAAEKLRAAHALWSMDGLQRPLADPLTREIEELLRAAEGALAAQQQQVEAVRRLIAEKRFYAARELFNRANSAVQAALRPERERIEAALSAADAGLRQAAAAPPDAAARLYLNILDGCADCQPAHQALARLPLLPPHSLEARAGSEVVTLDWQPSLSVGARYTVVRRADSAPAHAGDGELLATVPGTHYDDLRPEIGRPLFYAVFSERAGLYSSEAARLDTPVLLVRGIPQPTLTAQVDDHCVRLSWDAPPNISEVIVTRSETAPPRSPADGQLIPVQAASHAEDRTPENGRLYHYGVFAVFHDHTGSPVYAPGAFISAMPEAAPQPITDLKINARHTAAGHELRLSWPPPAKGVALILQSDRPTGLRPDQIIPEHDLPLYGTPHQGAGGRLTINVAANQTAYFVPVVLFRKTAYIGVEQYFAGVEDVTNLQAHNDNVALRLTWDWPPDCDRAIVAFAFDRFPEAEGQPDDGAERREIARPQYNLQGAFSLPNPALEDYHIVVYAVYQRGGRRIVAPGQAAGARRLVPLKSRIRIAYVVERPRRLFGSRPPALALTLSGHGHVPALLLVRKQGGVPINKTDGDVIYRQPEFSFDGPTIAYTENLPAAAAARPHSYARLFLEDDTLYDTHGGYIRIDHPLTDKLRLS